MVSRNLIFDRTHVNSVPGKLAASLPPHRTKLYTIQLATFKREITEVQKILKTIFTYLINYCSVWVNLSCWGGCHDRFIMNKALFDSYHQIEQGISGELGGYFHKKHHKECATCQNIINLHYNIGHLPLFENI